MKELRERILAEGRVLPGNILKVDGFLNHQLDPRLTLEMGREFRRRFEAAGVTGVSRVVTAEVSGIGPGLATAIAFDVPLVYARKKRPVTMSDRALEARAPSHTKGGITSLLVSPEYLRPGDRTLLIDDFLASGRTVVALAQLIEGAGAKLVGAGFVIEKSFAGGRSLLGPLGVPLVSLAVVSSLGVDGIVLADEAQR
ncbi:MAG TPA: xanthine phosphoribosyltransferase [Trueperaceae bacterium]